MKSHYLLILFFLESLLCFSQNDTVISYYGNHNKEFQCVVNNGLRQGMQYYWFKNGNPDVFAEYKNDTLNGKITYWYKSGPIKTEGTYVNGLKQGRWKSYYENGNLMSEEFYVKGIPDDTWITYFPGGNKKEEFFFVMGTLEGTWTSYYYDGSIYEKGTCEKGKKDDKWLTYWPNGNLRSEAWYYKGELIEEPISYTPSGNKPVEITLSFNNPFISQDHYRNSPVDGSGSNIWIYRPKCIEWYGIYCFDEEYAKNELIFYGVQPLEFITDNEGESITEVIFYAQINKNDLKKAAECGWRMKTIN